MRILYVSTPSFADADIDLIKSFQLMGHKVMYLMRVAPFNLGTNLFNIQSLKSSYGIWRFDEYPELKVWSDYLDISDFYVSNAPESRTTIGSFRLYLQEKRLCDEFKPDIVHHVETPSVFRLHLLYKYRHKSVCVIHDPVPHSGAGSFREELRRWISARFITRFVLLNNRQTTQFCSRYSVKESNVGYSSLGVYECMARFGKDRYPEGRYILFFGRISKYKGIEFACEAMERISNYVPDVKLIIAGAGEMYFDFSQYADSSSISLINRYLTNDELADYVRNAMFVVCPYTDATQSGVVQTSFALCTPIVATSVGNLPEVIQDGTTGLLVPPKDVDKLSMALLRMVNDSSLREMMRNNIAFENSSGKLSWSSIGSRYIELYESVLSAGQK